MPNKEQQPTNQNQELFRRMQMQKAAQESQSKPKPTSKSSSPQSSEGGLIENLSNQVNEGVEKAILGIFKFIPCLLVFARNSFSNIGRPVACVADDAAESVIKNWSRFKF